MSNETMRNSWERGKAFLGSRYAILGGAMSWLSEHKLVAAISEAGGFGVLATGNMPPEMLRQEIQGVRKLTDKPFGVNLIALNPQLSELVEICQQERVSHVVVAGGFPDKSTIAALKEADIKIMLFAPNLPLAKRLITRGADALIIEGHEAGGHVGPVATIVLAQEILPNIDEVPVFVAGGIANGQMVSHLVAMGAAGCQVGTRFVCTDECIAHENFKNLFIKASAKDAVVTAQFDVVLPVIPVRAIANKGTEAFNDLQLKLVQEVKAGSKDRKAAILELEHFWVGALKRAAIDGDVEGGSVMAGQSIGLIHKIEPVVDVVVELASGVEAQL
ncbi:2-nitropropane dioxygenase, NPD [Magnetococcus marinus MC-1]|uniref:2-nitropropane dioxygenase, NPD n=1 Tax=Magnetococcus marinus (strain ATCC BAA-1437 / JCM 17883 / MC-1) TaxID=156889 RepID=A0LDL6_MAGMM|nr:nitronate monooxygenase [Magnetococcus marinus]ABK46059.1 2-nitropropane dioxygenase, NPD [Magnetococcus marinus MC-1]